VIIRSIRVIPCAAKKSRALFMKSITPIADDEEVHNVVAAKRSSQRGCHRVADESLVSVGAVLISCPIFLVAFEDGRYAGAKCVVEK